MMSQVRIPRATLLALALLVLPGSAWAQVLSGQVRYSDGTDLLGHPAPGAGADPLVAAGGGRGAAGQHEW
jgi:hypothetical protein